MKNKPIGIQAMLDGKKTKPQCICTPTNMAIVMLGLLTMATIIMMALQNSWSNERELSRQINQLQKAK